MEISFYTMEELSVCYVNKIPLLQIFTERKSTRYIGHIMDTS